MGSTQLHLDPKNAFIKKEVKQDPNAGMNARLDTLIATTGKVNSISTLKIQ